MNFRESYFDFKNWLRAKHLKNELDYLFEDFDDTNIKLALVNYFKSFISANGTNILTAIALL